MQLKEEIAQAISALFKTTELLVKLQHTINELTPTETPKIDNIFSRAMLKLSADAEPNAVSQLDRDINEGHFCTFTEKEIKKMPRCLRNEFMYNRIKARIREKPNGSFEIRCQIKHNKISCCSKYLVDAKAKFVKKLQDLENNQYAVSKKISLHDYMEQWLEIAKKPYIKESTFEGYKNLAKFHIYTVFKNREIASISQMELQALINNLVKQGKFKTAVSVYQLLCSLFEYAEIDDLVKKSPMLKIVKPKYEMNKGTSLTRDEERTLINKLKNDNRVTFQAFAFIIYTGLRRAELPTVEMSDNWIRVLTAKQKKGMKAKYREIPISPMLKKVLPLIDIEEIKKVHEDKLTREIKLIFKNHHLHELRHTFITRCQECGIQRELVSLWAGHSADSSITSNVYTHLEQNKQHQIEEMQKYSYDF